MQKYLTKPEQTQIYKTKYILRPVFEKQKHYNVNRLKNKNNMSVPTDAEKKFEYPNSYSWLKLGIDGNILELIKNINEKKYTTKKMFSCEGLEGFHINREFKNKMFFPTTPIQHCTGSFR